MVTFDSPSPRMSHDAFAQKLMQKLRDAGDQRQARYDKVEFRLLFYREGRSIGYANLRNLYQEYCSRSLVDRSHFFQHATRSLLASHKTLPVDFPDAKVDVLLSVRNRSYFSLIELQNQLNGKGELSWPYLPLAEHLGVGLVYDLPEAMLMLQQSHLDDWGVSFYEAYEAAYLNLSESEAAFATLEERTYMSTTGDNYDASRLLVPELIEALKVDGHPVVMIPNRDRLFVTGSEDTEGLATMVLLAEHALSQPRPMSGMALWWNGEEWSTWLPDPGHPTYANFRSAALTTTGMDYRDQLPLLQRLAEEREPHVQVAEFKLHYGAAEQPSFSYCVWREGQTCWLPKTDRVCLLRHDQESDHPLVEGVNVTWEALEAANGTLEPVADFYPPVYHATHFPELRSMRSLQ
jgi:hypothetical protein